MRFPSIQRVTTWLWLAAIGGGVAPETLVGDSPILPPLPLSAHVTADQAIGRSNQSVSIDELGSASWASELPQIPTAPMPPPRSRPRAGTTAAPAAPSGSTSVDRQSQGNNPAPVSRRDRWQQAPVRPPAPPFVVSPQLAETRTPSDHDGLIGNRQVALTPFPNLDMQSGPLEPEQLPWRFRRPVDAPHSSWRTMALKSLAGFTESLGREDGNPALYNSAALGVPFWREREIGLQAGIAAEPTAFPTVNVFYTFGFFHQAIWPEDAEQRQWLRKRLSWGTTYDGLYDSEHRGFIGQSRTQFGFSLDPDRECGLWFAIPLHDDPAPIGSGEPILLDSAAHVSFYYRRTYASETDVTLFVGTSEDPGGAFVGSYFSYRFAEQATWHFSWMTNFHGDGGYAVFTGLEFHIRPLSTYALLSGNPENRYRPFLRMADPIQLQIRKRPFP